MSSCSPIVLFCHQLQSRMQVLNTLVFFLSLGLAWTWDRGDSKPHIVLFLIDDMGFNDIAYNNEDIISPNMLSLAEQGVKLNQFYAQHMCSPSRASLLTGLYPIHTGFQGQALGAKQKGGLETQYRTIAETLKDDYGYTTNMVGKWHLGWCNETYLPNSRGFDEFRGIWHSGTDHYSYLDNSQDAYDLHSGTDADYTYNGQYSTDTYANYAQTLIEAHDANDPLFMYVASNTIHTPWEVDTSYKSQYRGYGLSTARKKASAMVTATDDLVGTIKDSLESKGMWDNTVFIFVSDNGGLATGGASNWPLRGAKETYFEGGMRVPAFMYSPLFDGHITANTDNECLFHVSDFFPTIIGLLGGTTSGLDGIDQWESIIDGGSGCQRTNILHDITVNYDGSIKTAFYRDGNYKLMIGDAGENSGWYHPDDQEDAELGDAYDESLEYLFDVSGDDYEVTNLRYDDSYADIVADMTTAINSYLGSIVDFELSGVCSTANSINDNNEWYTGCCNWSS